MKRIYVILLLGIHSYTIPAENSSFLGKLLPTSACMPRPYNVRYDLETKRSIFGVTNDHLDKKAKNYDEEEKTTKIATHYQKYIKQTTESIHDTNQEDEGVVANTNLYMYEAEYLHRISLFAELTLELTKRTGTNDMGDPKLGRTLLFCKKMLDTWSPVFGNPVSNAALQKHLKYTQDTLAQLMSPNNASSTPDDE